MGSRKSRPISSGYSGGGYSYANRRRISGDNRRQYPVLDRLARERSNVEPNFQNDLSTFAETLATTATKSYLLHNYPICRDLYFAYKFSKFAYGFAVKVQDEYEQNGGDFPTAISSVASDEMQGFVATAPEMIMTYGTRYLWNEVKDAKKFETNNPVFDDIVQDAFSESLQEMIK